MGNRFKFIFDKFELCEMINLLRTLQNVVTFVSDSPKGTTFGVCHVTC